MPQGDKTGPVGEGPMTGRKQGLCVGNDHPGFESNEPGRGMGIGARNGQGYGKLNKGGRRRGFGRGYGSGLGRNRGFEDSSKEISNLRKENESLKNRIKEIEKKLSQGDK